MLEMKISITAADLAAAINNLAAALDGRKNAPADKPAAPVAQPATPIVNPMQATSAPLNVTPAPTVAPVQPIAPQTPAPVNYPTVAPTAPLVQAQMPITPPTAIPAANPVPTGAPQYTLEMIATAGTALVDAGKMDMLCALLTKYGIDSITKLDPAQYGVFAMELRTLGAQI